jgi:hypothetical protein
MTTFTIDTDNHITAHATPEEAAAATRLTKLHKMKARVEFVGDIEDVRKLCDIMKSLAKEP